MNEKEMIEEMAEDIKQSFKKHKSIRKKRRIYNFVRQIRLR